MIYWTSLYFFYIILFYFIIQAIMDLVSMKVNVGINKIALVIVLALAYFGYYRGKDVPTHTLVIFVVIYLFFFIMSKTKWLGAGDVDGIFIGSLTTFIMYGNYLGSVIFVVMSYALFRLAIRLKKVPAGTLVYLPYFPFMLFSYIITWVLQAKVFKFGM